MVHAFVRGQAGADGTRHLWHATFTAGTWSGWSDLGGSLALAEIRAFRSNDVIHVLVEGLAGGIYETTSSDEGATWTPLASLHGDGDSLGLLLPEAARPAGTVTIPGPITIALE